MDEHSHLGDACTIQIRNTEWDGMECVERRNDTRLSICVGDLFREVQELEVDFGRAEAMPKAAATSVKRWANMSSYEWVN